MMQSESYVLRHEACPKCRELGHDRHGNNLGVYSDHHTYCFRCGYSTGRKFLTPASPRPATEIVLPSDVSLELPLEARQWLEQYQLSRLDLQQNHVMWSERWSRIVFPYFDSTGLLAWQGRYIPCGKNQVEVNGKAPAKWFSQGLIHEIVHPVKVTKREAVLVEDIVSAIKVSKFVGAIPIFGSSISNKQLLRLKTVVDRVWYWLDKDIQIKSVKLAQQARMFGLDARVIITDLDPKLVEYSEIERLLTE